MAVKMPTLGQTTRRRGSGGSLGLLLVLAGLAGAGTVAYRARHPSHPAVPAPPPAPQALTPAATQPALPGSPVVAALKTGPLPAPPALTGPRYLALQMNGPLESVVIAASGSQTGPALAQVLSRVLVWWVRVPADLRRGDRLDVVYEERPGEEPQVDALRLTSTRFGKTFEAYRYKSPAQPFSKFYGRGGDEVELRLQPAPLDSYEQVTSLIKDGRRHKGVDFKTPVGTPVKATFAGTVTRKNWFFRGNGNSLEIAEAGSPHRRAIFLHLSELPRSFAVGRTIKAGEVIAQSGNSGHSFAPHLHYQLMSAGDRVLDPFDSQPTTRVRLPAAEKPQLERAVASWQALMVTQVAGTAAAAQSRVPGLSATPSR